MNIATNLATNVVSWFNTEKQVSSIKDLTNNQILNFANEVNSLFPDTKIIDVTMPSLIVVGTQSSGKSTVLNTFMSMDILPTGKNMVTRTPLDIRLHKTSGADSDKSWVEFGMYNDSGWVLERKYNISYPTPVKKELEDIRSHIEVKTNEIAGVDMNINATPIILNIYSPNVPDISFIDLPGLVMVACTDKGQPENIKEQIEELVISYIKKPKTIVLAVMQARPDLETDLGLALIKKYHNNNQTFGVLTKPDLMNYDSHIGDYLLNKISKNLMLSCGYYTVKNKTTTDIEKILDVETKYFSNHTEYKKSIYKEKIGYEYLIKNVCGVLIESIKNMLPNVGMEITKLENSNNQKLDILGPSPSTSRDSQLSELNTFVSSFSHKICECIESRDIILNIGRDIKLSFDQYISELNKIQPFKTNDKVYNEQYFKHLSTSFEGYHMSYNISLIDILEKCMTDEKNNPIGILRKPSVKCVNDIKDALLKSIYSIGTSMRYSKYPALTSQLIKIITDDLIIPLTIKTESKIDELIKIESEYIWTNDIEFKKELEKMSIKSVFDHNSLKDILEAYYNVVKYNFKNNVPKYVMSMMIRELQDNINNVMYNKIVRDDKVSLLKEDPEIESQRVYCNSIKLRITSLKNTFSCL